MNTKILKILRISLVSLGIAFLLLSIFVRYFEIEFFSPFNQWVVVKSGMFNSPIAYISIALVFNISASLLKQFELSLQNNKDKSV